MNRNEELTFTYSGIVNKDGRNAVCVRFERKRDGRTDFAEGLVPSCTITKQEGCTEEELEGLTAYLRENDQEIRRKAKELNNIRNWF